VGHLVEQLEAGSRQRLADHPFWYHTIDVAPGATTAGWFDLRHSLDLVPFPDVEGKRCLDIGTFDGFYAFEMERRGASEVLAIDVEDHEHWDWPPDARAGMGVERDPGFSGPPKGAGFRLIAETIGSKVEWRSLNMYDLDPEEVGRFDVVVCGTLLLHLRDPVRALEAARTVCDGVLFSSEQIELWLSIVGRRRPWFALDGSGRFCQWWRANSTGHQRMLFSAGFQPEQVSPFYTNRFNNHPAPSLRSPRMLADHLARGALTKDRNPGILHRAVLARPRL
jgi:tRNA (mo5U34)-methyltransferase